MSNAPQSAPTRGPFLAIWSAATIFVSAFLLFQVQPVISKTILPWFGGSPAVWTTCMLFFQVLLLGGYAYAHVLSRYLPTGKQGSVHCILLLLGILTLPINPSDYWKPHDTSNPSGQILWLLLCKVGIPYLLLSSTGPLVQAWFSKLYPGRSPFRLYALSNVGSLGALLTYPFLIEPMLNVKMQGYSWSVLFVLFVALVEVLGVSLFLLSKRGEIEGKIDVPYERPSHEIGGSPNLGLGIYWVFLAFLASLMFLSVTNHVCQDIAVVPFLWVIPRSLYLLSFIISFDSPRWYSRGFFGLGGCLVISMLVVMEHSGEVDASVRWLQTPIHGMNIPFTGKDVTEKNEDGVEVTKTTYKKFPVGVSTLVDGTLEKFDSLLRYLAKLVGAVDEDGISKWKLNFRISDFSDDMIVQGSFFFGMLFLVCMLCHGELYRSKPATEYLTMYYMLISLGGACGGLTVGLISPLFCKYPFELPLGIVCGFALSWLVLFWREREKTEKSPEKRGTYARNAVLITAAIVGGSLVYSTVKIQSSDDVLYRDRNFFGGIHVKKVIGNDPGDLERRQYERGRALYHGRILHGFQYLSPERIDDATTYYAESSGAGLAAGQYPRDGNQPIRVAVVGLGTGTMAAYARYNDEYRFYEIDPKVIKLSEAVNPQFTFIRRARDRGAMVDIVLGDARISMEREAREMPQGLGLDVLVLDAFSGDAIPAHLLTEEAMAIYEHHMAKGPDGKSTGILAIHISNRYLDLKPVVANLAEKYDYPITLIHDADHGDQGDTSSEWVLLTRNEEFLNNWSVKAGSDPDTEAQFQKKVRWTDQQSNLFEIWK
ncbi:MAG: hypothetical protein U0894_06035 [Pirellulales bacterium]